ncbi:hypothetical protein HK104_006394 [Borealophlyctis nickersoniae]|nr:hypothetical protein HK104_006394 [Borealophlyctis nickersoniae]
MQGTDHDRDERGKEVKCKRNDVFALVLDPASTKQPMPLYCDFHFDKTAGSDIVRCPAVLSLNNLHGIHPRIGVDADAYRTQDLKRVSHFKATIVGRRDMGTFREYTLDTALAPDDPMLKQQPFTLTLVDVNATVHLMRRGLHAMVTNGLHPSLKELLLGKRANVMGMSSTLAVPGRTPLTDEQKAAFKVIVSHPIALLNGPAGSGKSQTLEAYIRAVVEETCHQSGVLIAYTAPANATIDQFLLNVLDLGYDKRGILLNMHNRVQDRIDPRLKYFDMDQQIYRAAKAMVDNNVKDWPETPGLEEKKGVSVSPKRFLEIHEDKMKGRDISQAHHQQYCWALPRIHVVLVQKTRLVAGTPAMLIKWRDVFEDAGMKLVRLIRLTSRRAIIRLRATASSNPVGAEDASSLLSASSSIEAS